MLNTQRKYDNLPWVARPFTKTSEVKSRVEQFFWSTSKLENIRTDVVNKVAESLRRKDGICYKRAILIQQITMSKETAKLKES